MIDFIINVFTSIFRPVLQAIANLLPVVNPSDLPFREGIETILETGYQFGFIIPWQAIFISLAIIGSIELVVLIMKFIMWVMRLARG